MLNVHTIGSKWQGLLDFKFLNDRYVRGKAAVSDFMEKDHKLVSFPSLILGHSLIVEKQASMGPNGSLGH